MKFLRLTHTNGTVLYVMSHQIFGLTTNGDSTFINYTMKGDEYDTVKETPEQIESYINDGIRPLTTNFN